MPLSHLSFVGSYLPISASIALDPHPTLSSNLTEKIKARKPSEFNIYPRKIVRKPPAAFPAREDGVGECPGSWLPPRQEPWHSPWGL